MKLKMILTLFISFEVLSAESKFIISLDKRIYQNYEIENNKNKINKIKPEEILPECGFSHENKVKDINEIDSYCIIGNYELTTQDSSQINWKCTKDNSETYCYAIIVED